MKAKKIAVIATTLSLAISSSSLAASRENRFQSQGYSSNVTESSPNYHSSSNLKKRIAPLGKGPVIGEVPFRHDGAKTVVNHTMLKHTAPPGKGFVRTLSNSR